MGAGSLRSRKCAPNDGKVMGMMGEGGTFGSLVRKRALFDSHIGG